MTTFSIKGAKTQLSRLIARAERGEEIIIARGKNPVARLSPVGMNRCRPVFGALKGALNVPDSFFFDLLSEEELGLWEGADKQARR